MNVIQINSGDLVGRRFNGYDLQPLLEERGVNSKHLAWTVSSGAPFVKRIFDYPGSRLARRVVGRIERELSIDSMLQLQSFSLPLDADFRRADLVHYHIIHNGYFSILALPWLSRLKPTIWTWHDPWMMTGHCIYPMDCDHWTRGCGNCPDLDRPLKMRHDRTALNFRWKQRAYAKMDVDVVLASRWMMEMARRSPLARGLRLHHVPFGIDLAKFRPRDPAPARERLGVLPGRTVICLRTYATPYKGLPHFLEAVERLGTDHRLCLLAFHEKGHLNHLVGRHQVIELGWTDDEAATLDAYAAADFFVMPSTAEAFGMMAIEAMSCGRPVICFEGTSLPEVTFAPSAGLAVPMGDAAGLALAMRRWITHPEEARARGELSRSLAEKHYGAQLHADRLVALYHAAVARRREGASAATHRSTMSAADD